MDSYTNERVKKALQKFIKKVSKQLTLENVILFGSRARGDYLLTSDVDIILISKDFEKIPFRERPVEVLDAWNEEIDLEVLCYTPEEFERMKKRLGIVQQAAKEGIQLVS